MQKYIIRRVFKKIEAREIEVVDFDEARKQLAAFIKEPIPEDCARVDNEYYDFGHVEYIGDSQ